MTASKQHHVHEFGGFYLDSAQRLLFTVDGERIPLPSRAFDTLLFMVEHPGELLETDRLMTAIWPNIIVEENNLQQIITTLRRALGEKPEDHKFIVTSRGQGYRFVAPVHPVILEDDTVASAAWRGRIAALWAGGILVLGLLVAMAFYLPVVLERSTTGADAKSVTVAAVPSIAVLPFADLSPDGDQASFSRGISDELLTQLSQLKGLRVAGRASSALVAKSNMDPRAVREVLGVGHVLQGSIRKDGDRVRISVQLVSTADGYQLWSKTYERRLDDVFAVQDEIAKAVAGALSIALDVDADNRMSGTEGRNVDATDRALADRREAQAAV
jgi:TolB-like protein/DNA-binding winged helix-turn-helix (wHTH) protein